MRRLWRTDDADSGAWRRGLVSLALWLPAALAAAGVTEIHLADNPSRGGLEAPLILVEFTDYNSPYCAKAARETLPPIYRRYVETGKVRHVVMNFVLDFGRPTRLAAGAAECAHQQGRFWELHQRLLEDPGAVTQPVVAGRALGLDATALAACLRGGQGAEAERRDAEEARRLGVGGVPSFVVAAADPAKPETARVIEVVPGARLAPLEAAIERALTAPPPAPAQPVPVRSEPAPAVAPSLTLHAVELSPTSVAAGQKLTLEWELTAAGSVDGEPVDVVLSYQILSDGNSVYRSPEQVMPVPAGQQVRKAIRVGTGPPGSYTLVATARLGQLEQSAEKGFQVR